MVLVVMLLLQLIGMMMGIIRMHGRIAGGYEAETVFL